MDELVTEFGPPPNGPGVGINEGNPLKWGFPCVGEVGGRLGSCSVTMLKIFVLITSFGGQKWFVELQSCTLKLTRGDTR